LQVEVHGSKQAIKAAEGRKHVVKVLGLRVQGLGLRVEG